MPAKSNDMTQQGKLRPSSVRSLEGTNVPSPIEKLMDAVGTRGFFQRRYNITFNLIMGTFAGMFYINFIVCLTVPDHWCHVPGREATNFSIEEWKAIHIPRMADNRSYEQCVMFANSSTQEVVSCQNGWDYDQTWFSRTAPSQENWVCDRRLHAVNVLSFSQLGDVAGAFLFGRISDMWGRRTAFFLSAVSSTVLYCLMVGTSHVYPLFFAVVTLASGTKGSNFLTPLIYSLEVSDESSVGFVAMLQCVGSTIGLIATPMIAWACRDWVPFMIITSLPLGFAICFWKWFPESPRWLAARGRPVQCLASLREIARVNGRPLPSAVFDQLDQAVAHEDENAGVASLVSSRTLFKNTAITAICRMVFALGYYSVLLNVTYLGGNPFLNWSVQAASELPGYVGARWLADRFGRRWTLVGAVACTALWNFLAASIAADESLSVVMSVLSVLIRLSLVVMIYTSYLQSIEVFPTCVRQTGGAVSNVASGCLSVIGPYIVHLGTRDVRVPFLVIGGVTVVGAVLATFIPETLHVRLPETLEEARVFGRDQPYFSCVAVSRRRQRQDESEPPSR